MKLFKSAIVLALVGIACGLLIGTVNMITEPVIKGNLLKIARKAYEEFYPELDDLETDDKVDSPYVYEFVKIKSDGKVIGYAFRAKGNNPRGVIDVVVAADTDGKILGVKILSTENTPGYYDRYEGTNKHLIGVKGNNLSNLNGIDVIGGASQTGDSLDAILKAVATVAAEKIVIEPTDDTDYVNMFGNNIVIVEDDSFTPTELIVKKENIYDENENLLGFAYTGKVTTTDIPGKGDGADLELLVGIKLDGKVAGVIVLLSEHTEERFEQYYAKVDALAGVNLDDMNVLPEAVDGVGNASLSGHLINDILNAVKSLVTNELETAPYNKLFGNNVVVEIDNTFTPSGLITKKEYVKDDKGILLGIAYTGKVTTFDIPGKGDGADLELLVGIKLDGKVAGVIVLLSEHTPNRFEQYYAKVDALAGVNLDDMNVLPEAVDGVGNASLSGHLINDILDEVKALAVTSILNIYYEYMFGDKVLVTNDDAFVGNAIVTKKEEVKDSDGNLLGYVYTGTATSTEIPRTDTADLTLMVGVDTSGKVKGLYTVYREHTPGFYDKYNAEFVNVAGVDIAELLVDKLAGSTLSHGIIEQILNAIKGVA